MANPNPDISNLKPIKSKKVARKLGRKGGIKSGESKRKKKLLSEMYAEILADDNGIDGKGKSIKEIIKEIIRQRAPHSVSMIKEIREATEGSKLALTNSEGNDLFEKGIKITFEGSDNV